MTRQDTIWKWLAYGIMLAATAIVNYYILGPLPIALPLLLPMAAVAVGTLENPKFGAGFGLAAGLVMATAGHHSLLCIPILSAAGWLCAMVAQYVLRRDLVGHLICAVITAFLWEGAQLLWHLSKHTAPLSLLLGVAGGELLWTLVFSIPVYWAGRFCCVRYGRIYHE